MIYLIESAALRYTESGDKEYRSILKIGYSNESKINSRTLKYRTENPTINLLHTIPLATQGHENALHRKFKDHKLKEGVEWFEYDQEIVDYIKSVTIEELDVLPVKDVMYSGYYFDMEFIEHIRIIMDIVKRDFSDYGMKTEKEVLDHIVVGKKIKTIEGVYSYFGMTEEEIKLFTDYRDRNYDALYKDLGEEDSKKMINFMESFDNLDMINKYKLLCETGPTLSEEGLDILFKQIPTHFGEHYKHLGPDKIIATSYNTTLMNKHLQIILNPFDYSSLDSEIYSNFNEGQKYLLSEINDILKIIYQNNDIQKTTIATDLDNYFETKLVYMISPDKRRLKGLKLIKRLR